MKAIVTFNGVAIGHVDALEPFVMFDEKAYVEAETYEKLMEYIPGNYSGSITCTMPDRRFDWHTEDEDVAPLIMDRRQHRQMHAKQKRGT